MNTHCECVFLRSLLDGLLACRLLAPKEWFRLKNTHCEWVFFYKKNRDGDFHKPPSPIIIREIDSFFYYV